jgi:hypothetical protein
MMLSTEMAARSEGGARSDSLFTGKRRARIGFAITQKKVCFNTSTDDFCFLWNDDSLAVSRSSEILDNVLHASPS